MNLMENYQYQGINSYKLITFETYNYWDNDRRKALNFSNISEWGSVITPVTNATVLNASNSGLTVFTGVTDSDLNAQQYPTYNPLSYSSRVTTKPFQLNLVNQGGAKLVNFDYKDNTAWLMKFKTTGAGNVAKLRLYTDTANAQYYEVTFTMPIANTEYTFAFNPFVAGNYGVVGTAITIGSRIVNTAQAVVSVTGATGTLVKSINLFASAVTASTAIIPIYGEANNNATQHLGYKLVIPTCCPAELTKALEREYNELKCKEDISGKTIKSQKLTFTLKLKKSVELLNALGMSNDIYEQQIITYGEKQIIPVTVTATNVTATLTSGITGSNLAMVKVDTGSRCFALQRDYVNNTTATLDNNFYYVDTSTATPTLILPQSMANILEVEAYAYTSVLARVVDYYTKNNPFKALCRIERKSATGVQTMGDIMLLELGYPKMSSADDGDEFEFENTVLLTGYGQAISYTY